MKAVLKTRSRNCPGLGSLGKGFREPCDLDSDGILLLMGSYVRIYTGAVIFILLLGTKAFPAQCQWLRYTSSGTSGNGVHYSKPVALFGFAARKPAAPSSCLTFSLRTCKIHTPVLFFFFFFYGKKKTSVFGN